jgi:chemotaxis response regulator CheB
MADIMSRHTQLKVKEAQEGDKIRPAHVDIARPTGTALVTQTGR